MKTGTIWFIAICAGIFSVLILIGIIALLIKFCVKHCRHRAWQDITSLSQHSDSSRKSRVFQRMTRHSATDRQPLYPSDGNQSIETSDPHISIPIDENEIAFNQNAKQPPCSFEHSQRERLSRLRDERNRVRPSRRFSQGQDEIQRVIDQIQQEFDASP
jgi:hypothetical protein